MSGLNKSTAAVTPVAVATQAIANRKACGEPDGTPNRHVRPMRLTSGCSTIRSLSETATGPISDSFVVTVWTGRFGIGFANGPALTCLGCVIPEGGAPG